MPDLYVEAKQDLDRLRKLFQRLHLEKEKEIAVRRTGKRLPASEIKEMREMEATIAALLERQKIVTNAQQRNLFETYKSQYHANMRGWRNRLAFSEQQRIRRQRRLAARSAASHRKREPAGR
jgi:molecular chaperone DnaK (HSP70)